MKQKIQIGDYIKVINPMEFVRCGYPKCIESEVVVLKELDFDLEIHRMLSRQSDKDIYGQMGLKDKVVQKILREVAYYRLNVNGFGGRLREIHEIEKPELLNRDFVVLGKFRVVTGEYQPATNWGDEYDPAYLTNQKHHTILELLSNTSAEPIKINQTHTQLVEKLC